MNYLIIAHDSNKLLSEEEKEALVRLFAKMAIGVQNVKVHEVMEEEVIKSLPSILQVTKPKKEESVLEKATNYIKNRYDSIIAERDDAKLVVQLLTDINEGSEEAEMLKNCIRYIANLQYEGKLAKLLAHRVYKSIVLIYNSHLV